MDTKEDGLESKHLNPKPSSSTSTASSTSDDDDFIQFDSIDLDNSLSGDQATPPRLSNMEGPQHLHRPTKSFMGRESDIGRLSTTVSPADIPISISAGNPFMAVDSPYAVTLSPPVQVMAKSNVADPHRIPASVFARTTGPAAATDWSVASNESLFSIHGGNYSFSRDHVLLMGKVGEDTAFPGPHDPFPPPPPKGLTSHETATRPHGGDELTMRENVNDLAIQESSSPAFKSSNAARVSNGSAASVHSFVFPILAGDAGKCVSMKDEAGCSQPTQKESMNSHEQPLKPTAETSGRGSCCCSSCFPCICCCPQFC